VKRLIALIVACAALALPALAVADSVLLYKTKTRSGAQTTGRAATGSCSLRNTLAGVLDMRCATDTGTAQAVYRFRLPQNFKGVPAVHASTKGPVHIATTVRANVVRVVATLSQSGSAQVLMVSVGYYTEG
jgi:hypothetical protein